MPDPQHRVGTGLRAVLTVIVLHVVAALRHHLVKRNDVLRRMISVRRVRPTA